MPSVVNKPFLKQNLAFGTKSEHKILPLIQHHFCGDLQRADDEFSNFDYISNDCVVELKTRRGNYLERGYGTFPFDAVKLDRYKILKKQNPQLEGYVCWYWKDMNKLHYWKIHTNDTNDIDHYASHWVVDGISKPVIEVFREDTQCITI